MPVRTLVCRLAALAGLGSSAALLYAHAYSSTALCGVGSGCQAVQNSAYASLAGIPTPLVGLAYFAAMLLAQSLGPDKTRVVRLLSAIGALAGLAFIALQALVIERFCPYCLVADLSALLLAASVWMRSEATERLGWRGQLLSFGAAAALALLFIRLAPAPESARTTSVEGRDRPAAAAAAIVEFVDFQCPACRALHARLRQVIDELDIDLRIERKHLPLPNHRHAETAARAYCCAEELGATEPMADRLFAARDLSRDGCRNIAEELGLDRAAFVECMSSSRPTALLEAHSEEARELGIRALPTLFIGDTRFEGAPSVELLRDEIAAFSARAP